MLRVKAGRCYNALHRYACVIPSAAEESVVESIAKRCVIQKGDINES